MRLAALAARSPPTRVLICDDSAVVREALARLLETDPDVQVVARAANGQAALQALARNRVDVVLLDIEMPVMDGLTALPLLLRAAPGVRIIMASTLTRQGATVALRALRDGAVDVLAKPGIRDMEGDGFRRELLAKVKGHASLPADGRAALPHGLAAACRPDAEVYSPSRARRVVRARSSTLLHGLSARTNCPFPSS